MGFGQLEMGAGHSAEGVLPHAAPPTPRKDPKAQEAEQTEGELSWTPIQETRALLKTRAVGQYLAPVCVGGS